MNRLAGILEEEPTFRTTGTNRLSGLAKEKPGNRLSGLVEKKPKSTLEMKGIGLGPLWDEPGDKRTMRERLGYEFAKPISTKKDITKAAKETPMNLWIGTVGMSASVLEALKREGMRYTGGGILPDEIVRQQFEAVTPSKREDLRQGPLGLLAPEPGKFMPGAITSEAFGLTTRLPDVGAKIIRDYQQKLVKEQDEVTLSKAPITKLFRSVTQSGVPSMSVAVGLSLLTKNPMVGLGVLGLIEGGAAGEQQLQEGGSVRKAMIIGDLSAAAEIGGEMLVFPKFVKGLKEGIPLAQALTLIVENAGQEGATGFTQRFLEVFGTQTTKGMASKEAAQLAFKEGVKAIPENAWVGGATAGLVDLVSTGTGRMLKGPELKESLQKKAKVSPKVAARAVEMLEEGWTPGEIDRVLIGPSKFLGDIAIDQIVARERPGTAEQIKADRQNEADIAEMDRELREIQVPTETTETPATEGVQTPKITQERLSVPEGVKLPPGAEIAAELTKPPEKPSELTKPAEIAPKVTATEEVTDEELSGITQHERRRLVKENAAKIESSDIYQNEVAGLETAAREVGPGYYYINEGYKGEVEAIIGKRKGPGTKIQRMFTFNPRETRIVNLQAGGKAEIGPTPWESAVQEGLGRGKEGVEETWGEMDISEFVQRVVDSHNAQETIGGINAQALEAAEQSGHPDLQLWAEKQRMLAAGMSDHDINEMVTEWADEWEIDVADIEGEFVNEYGTRIRQIKQMKDPTAALEQLATEQIEAEERQDAVRSAKEVLEANDITAEVEAVEDIRPRDLLDRPVLEGGAAGKQRGLGELGLEFTKPEVKDPDQMEFGDTIPFERRGRPVGAAITQGQKQVILLAYGADSETGYHEGYHILRRRLTEKSTKVLDKYFKGDEEAEATAFAQYVKTGKTQTFLRGIWQKLRNVLSKVKSGMMGRGFKTAEDIFGAIRKGTVAQQATREGVAFETRPIFYSKLDRAVQNMPAKMSRESFRNWANKQGIKREEMIWSGVSELLNTNPTVTKQQILDTIAANNIQIEEVTKGGPGYVGVRDLHQVETELRGLATEQARMSGDINIAIQKLPTEQKHELERRMGVAGPTIVGHQALGSIGSTYQQSENARNLLRKAMPDLNWEEADKLADRFYELQDERDELKATGEGAPQFERYTLPGGANYTELLLTMPRSFREIPTLDNVSKDKYGKTFDKIKADQRAIVKSDLKKQLGKIQVEQAIYMSPHWKEENVLAHIRFTDRWTPGEKRVLFIEEIQSDWHQTGRRKGYRKALTEKERSEIGRLSSEAGYDLRQTGEYETSVPDAPFKKTWHELSLKRMLRYAAENGYDRIAWTTGEQQAERYDLSKVVEEVTAVKGKAGISLTVTDKNGRNVIDSKLVQPNELDDIIGKELSDRIRQQKESEHTYTDLELKVGGEGMKAFYDKMVPQFLRKYAKKWGATIGTTKIEAGETVEGETVEGEPFDVYGGVKIGKKVYENVPSMIITSKMKESVMAGQVQFETRGEKLRRDIEKKARVKARAARIAKQNKIKVKKVSRARIKIRLQDHTPPLREDLAPPAKAKPEPSEERPLTTKTLTQPVYTEKWFEANLKRERRSILDKAGSETRRAWMGLEKVFSSSSTRLNNIAPKLFRATRQYIYNVLTRSTEMTEDVSDFVRATRKMSKDDWRQLDLALKNGIDWKTDQLIVKYGLTEQFQQVRTVLDEIYDAAKEVGIDIDYRKNYWPRVLKDPEGFLMYFQGREDWSIIEEAIKRRAEQAGRKIEDLTVDEKAHVVNTLLRGYRTQALTLSRPGPAKERTVESIDKELDTFYDDSKTALHKYIRLMNAKIAEREFFGRETKELQNLRKTQSARLTRLLKLKRRVGLKYPSEPAYKEHISKTAQNWKEGQERLERLKARPLSETIGGYVMRLQAEGEISPTQEKEIQGLLTGIFDPQRMSSRMGLFATGIYIDTLNSPLQALTQLDEFAYSFYRSPIRSIPVAIRTAARKSKITPKDIGLTSIGEEFQEPSMKRALSLLLKSTGFEMIDRLNKENYINTVLSKYQAQAKRKNLNATFVNRIRKVFGDDYKGVIEDLRNNRISDNVKYLLFNEILDIQPIAITEMPEAYNKAGNMRILYSLKTFYMKRLDFVRNECFRDMKSSKTFARGFGKLVWLAGSFALMGAGSDLLKDFIRGKPFDLEDSIVDNLLRMGFFSKYQAWRTKEKGLGTAALEGWRPPTKAIDAVTRDIINEAQGKERGWELWRSVPIVGEFYYWWFGEGRKKIERKQGKKTSWVD